MESNTAGSADGSTGLGGGIFMGDKCSGGTCTTVGATLQNVTFSLNYAHLVRSLCPGHHTMRSLQRLLPKCQRQPDRACLSVLLCRLAGDCCSRV